MNIVQQFKNNKFEEVIVVNAVAEEEKVVGKAMAGQIYAGELSVNGGLRAKERYMLKMESREFCNSNLTDLGNKGLKCELGGSSGSGSGSETGSG